MSEETIEAAAAGHRRPAFEKLSWAFEHLLIPTARAIAWILMTLFGPLVRRHARRVPKTGGLLILSNHQADCDPIAIYLSCPRTIYFMSKSELFEMKFIGFILRAFKAFPVKRGEPDRAAIKHAVNVIKSGEAVCVFPEGELSETGEILPLKPGVSLIARLAGAPVICCRVVGTRRIMPYGKVIPKPAFHKLSVTWSEPRVFTKEDDAQLLTWAEEQFKTL